MAIPAATSWCVRSDGADTNGGGFVVGSTGVNYSNQAAAQNSGTFGTAAGTAAFHDAGYSFVANDVGNLINISSGSGFTVGFYQIVSVSSGIATLDRSPGTGSVAVWSEGGSLLTLAKVLTPVTAGNTVNLKNGTYTITTGLTLPTTYFSLVGFNTSYGDLNSSIASANRPIITTATNSTVIFTPGSTGSQIFCYNVKFTNTAGISAAGYTAGTGGIITGGQLFSNCYFSGFIEAINGKYSGTYTFGELILIQCEFTSCSSASGAVWNNGGNYVDGCNFHGNTNAGMYLDQGPNGNSYSTTVVNSAFSGNVYGLYTTVATAFRLKNNNFYNNTDGIRFNVGGQTQATVIENNIFSTQSGYGVNFTSTSAATTIIALNNAFYNNTTANWHNYTGSVGDITLTGNPWTTAGTNYALNSTAGAGASCKGAGNLGTIPGGGAGTANVGALDPSSGGGGSGSMVVNPGMTGGIRG